MESYSKISLIVKFSIFTPFLLQFLLQDTKSSNGTFINNIRLSQGAEESQPYELKSGDTIQFGVDVVESSKNGMVESLDLIFFDLFWTMVYLMG